MLILRTVDKDRRSYNGIKPNTPYKLDDGGNFIEVVK